MLTATFVPLTFLVNLPSTSTGTTTPPPQAPPQPPQQRISSEFFNQAMASALNANAGRNTWQVGVADQYNINLSRVRKRATRNGIGWRASNAYRSLRT